MSREYTSNLINDIEMTKKFNSVAYSVARSLRTKYFSLYDYMSEDDVVMECWSKILSTDICFDETRNCKFESFVRIIVNSVCLDLCRKIRKHEVVSSLDYVFSFEDGENTTLADFIPDCKVEDIFKDIEIQDILESFNGEIYSFPIYEVLKYISDGYSIRDTADNLGLEPSDVRKAVRRFSGVAKRRYDGTGQTLADLIYDNDCLEYYVSRNNEDYKIKQRIRSDITEDVLPALRYIKDSDGVKLSDVVKLVIKGYTYKGIAEKYGVTEVSIKEFLDRCSMIIV